jgi:hypothetical protein
MGGMRMSPLLLGVGLLAALSALPGAGAADSRPIQPIVGTDRLAQPATAAPLEGSSKRFIKADPRHAPRLSPRPEEAGPIIPPLTLKGHTESPPTTTKPLKPVRAHGTPPGGE